MTKTLYPLVAGAVPTHILNDFTFGDAARIVVENVEDIPDAPNIVTIKDNSDAFITVEYSTFTGNILSGLVFVSGDINHVFLAGSYVSRCYTTYDHEALVEFIETKETSVPGSSLVPDVKVASYDAHLIDTENPHAVTKAQVGLGNVDNTSDAEKVNTSDNPINVALATKVDKVTGSSLVPDTKVTSYDVHLTDKSNPHEVTKSQVGLGNTVDGAQINVIESISKNGTEQTIVNKNVNLVLSKSDVGLGNVDNTSDSEKATTVGNPIHDAIETKEPAFTKNTAFNKDFGNTTGTVCQGDDSRLSDARTPTGHAASHASGGTDEITIAESQVTNLVTDLAGKAPTSHAAADTTYGIASATNYGHPKATSAAPSDATLAAAVGTDNGLYARGDHSHAKETFTMNGVTINSGDWVSDSTYSDYPYKATISNSSISASHIPIVILSSDDAISGNICTVALAADGSISIYARYALPCVISKIAFIKE